MYWIVYSLIAIIVFLVGYVCGIQETQAECDELKAEEVRRQLSRGRYNPVQGSALIPQQVYEEDPS